MWAIECDNFAVLAVGEWLEKYFSDGLIWPFDFGEMGDEPAR